MAVVGGGINEQLGINSEHYCIKTDEQQKPAIWPGNDIQHAVITYNGKEYRKNIYNTHI